MAEAPFEVGVAGGQGGNMDPLELLRELASSALPDEAVIYSPRKLRFVLELNAASWNETALETLRAHVATLLGTGNFQLEAMFGGAVGARVFVVLALPGVERTLPADILYRMAGSIREGLGLVSCEPDTGEGIYADPDLRSGPRSEAAIVDAFCMATGAPPADRLWALKNIRAVESWVAVPSLGAGIRIAQLDTGITDHPEMVDCVTDLSSALNLMEGGTDPTDPLRPGTANPGHGTATGSAAVSGRSGSISGAAPGATLIPIRCIEDVKVFNASPIARGIAHAMEVDAHVITMSLGGIGSRALESVIQAAVDQDIIVIAAAGNCVGLVVWPAAYPSVIAVGGSGPSDRPWRGTSSGAKVEFSAPAEFVWVADRRSNADATALLNAGQGTSFATALTAGAAAIWLAHFGRDAVIVEARERGISVQELFRVAAVQTARRPADWDVDRNGSGILDCKALVDLPLSAIGTRVAGLPGGLEAAMTELLGPGQMDSDFDWIAHGAEVSGMLIADSKAGRGRATGAAESKAFRVPSAELAAAAAGTTDPRLARLMDRHGMRARGLATVPSSGDRRNAGIITGLASVLSASGGQESSGALDLETGRKLIGSSEALERLKALEARLRSHADPRLSDLVGALSGPLEQLRRHGAQARLSEIDTVSLEALIELEGRPAIPVTATILDGGRILQTVDGNHHALGRYQGLVNVMRSRIEDDCLASVGRIDADGRHVGTGFVVAPGLVLTNRHVLQKIAAPLPTETDPARWMMFRTGSINFSPAANDPRSRFIVREVVFAGPDPIIDDVIDFSKLDLALLRVDATNPSGGVLPKQIALDTAEGLAEKRLFVVGYPAPPELLPLDDLGRVRQDVVEALRDYYGISYGQKFLSPGEVKSTPDGWWFDHDSTTLGGNSGSLVCNFANIKAFGLHFAGDWLKANQAHELSVVLSNTPALSNAIRQQ